jgi:carbonic anhydrase
MVRFAFITFLLLFSAFVAADEPLPAGDLRQRLADKLKDKKEPVRAVNPSRAPANPVDAARMGKSAKPAAKPVLPWGYTGEGAPERWGELAPENKLCAVGTRQSPIDIRDSLKVDLEPIQFDYHPQPFTVQDTGRTVLVTPEGGSGLTVRQRRYELRSIETRMPAEMLLAGRRMDAALHLMHRDAEGRIAVLALLLERGEEAAPALQRMLNHLPLEKHLTETVPAPLKLMELLPEDRSYFTFMGSLTTPPCTEGVLWLVMRKPLTVSAQQLAVLQRLYPMNARPVQPTGGRIIKESF